MNETLQHISRRYSCRDFKDTPLTDEQIEALVGAALAAPSARNLQPWHIIVVTDKALIEEMDAEGMDELSTDKARADIYQNMLSRGGKLFYNAPCMFVILYNGSNYGPFDCGILGQNIVLAAQSLGLGTCYVGMAAVPLAGPRADEFIERLKFPEGYEFAMGILVGTINSGKPPHEPDPSKVSYIG